MYNNLPALIVLVAASFVNAIDTNNKSNADQIQFCHVAQRILEAAANETYANTLTYLKQGEKALKTLDIDVCSNDWNLHIHDMAVLLNRSTEPTVILKKLKCCKSLLKLSQSPKKFQGFFKCSICKLVFNKLVKVIEKKVDMSLERRLNEVCHLFPRAIESRCLHIVGEYTDLLVEFAIAKLPSHMFCDEINFCTTQFNFQRRPVLKESIKGNNVKCEACKLIISSLENIVKRNETQEEIKNILKHVCNAIPVSVLAKKCVLLVENYVEVLLTIVEHLDPNEICQTVNLCAFQSHTTKAKIVQIIPEHKRALDVNVECEVCKLMISSIEYIFKRNETQDEIEKVLKRVCNEIPDIALAKKCVAYVDRYIEILMTIVERMDPNEICQTIKLCTSQSHTTRTNTMVQRSQNGVLKGIVECDTCKLMISRLENIVKRNETQEEIKNILKHVCNAIPDSALAKRCDALVDKYLELLMNLIVEQLHPNEVCQILGLCQSNIKIEKVNGWKH